MTYRKHHWLSALLATLALGVSSLALAQTGPSGPPQIQPPQVPPPQVISPQVPPQQPLVNPLAGATLNHDSLGVMLRGMGFEPKEQTHQSGNRDWTLTCPRGEWTYHVRFAFSGNGKVLWLSFSLLELPQDRTTVNHLWALLEKNSTGTGKAMFSRSGKYLSIAQPVDNRAITPAQLRVEMDDILDTVVRLENLWNPARWAATSTASTPQVQP